jgi:hypothetical protein
MIHFAITFLEWLNGLYLDFFLHVICTCFNIICGKDRLSFLHYVAFASLSRISWLYQCGCISVSLTDLSTLPLISHCLDYSNYILGLLEGACQTSKFVQGCLLLHKITCWYFEWNCIESIGQVEKNVTSLQYWAILFMNMEIPFIYLGILYFSH